MQHNLARILVLSLILSSAVSLRDAHAGPLAKAEAKAFRVTAKDPLNKIKGDHYLRSNESELQLYAPYVNHVSLGYVGVGADQNYTLAAMAQSTHVWLMDYDPWVTRLHWIYRALIAASATAQGLVRLWPQRDKVRALLNKTYAGEPERLKSLLWIYKRFRLFLKPYLRWSLKRKRDGKGTTWLSNPTLYKRVRKMWAEGRIQPLSGDLHGKHVFQSICAAAKKLKIPIRIVYLSNAEEYLPYSKQFRANMSAVPWDFKSIVVRTVRGKKYPMKGDRWHYNVQPFGKDYLRRLGTGKYSRIHAMMDDLLRAPWKIRRKLMRPRGFSRFVPSLPDREQRRQRYLRSLRRPRPRR